VSFTFDDFPRSAWLYGGPILEKYDLRGTYYAAMGFAGGGNHLGPMFEIDDLRAAHARGHEIACHTYSHRDCMRAPPAEIVDELERNGVALAQILNAPLVNFAYPFGGVSQTAKRAAHNRFASCRGTGRGINHGTVDLADLLSNSVYSCDFDHDRLCQLVDDAQAVGGWVIFFTHDVAENPSDFGCTPDQLNVMPLMPRRTRRCCRCAMCSTGSGSPVHAKNERPNLSGTTARAAGNPTRAMDRGLFVADPRFEDVSPVERSLAVIDTTSCSRLLRTALHALDLRAKAASLATFICDNATFRTSRERCCRV
jgi:hypothetical protein